MWPETVLFFFILSELGLGGQQILVMVNNEQTSAGVESSPKKEQNLTILRHSGYNVTVPSNELAVSNDSSASMSEPSNLYSASTEKPVTGNEPIAQNESVSGNEPIAKNEPIAGNEQINQQQTNQTIQQSDNQLETNQSTANLPTTEASAEASTSSGKRFIFCPHYLDKKDGRKETSDLMRYTFNSAIALCNTSSRVGCKDSDFLRQISSCANSVYFNFEDIRNELFENKEQQDLPRDSEENPVVGYISFKVVNINAFSVKDMDFKMDFYLGVSWDVTGRFFRKYMTRICVAKKLNLEKRKKLILYQKDLKLFWRPDLYFPNSKSMAKDDEKGHLKRPTTRDYLEVSFQEKKKGEPFIRFVFVTSGHSNLLCPMQFNDYPSDVQKCVVKIRSCKCYSFFKSTIIILLDQYL